MQGPRGNTAVTRQQVLDYHRGERPGKIEVTASKPCRTQPDLSMAYTPGVAIACLDIQKNSHNAFKYPRGNLVAVVGKGTAVSVSGILEPWLASP